MHHPSTGTLFHSKTHVTNTRCHMYARCATCAPQHKHLQQTELQRPTHDLAQTSFNLPRVTVFKQLLETRLICPSVLQPPHSQRCLLSQVQPQGHQNACAISPESVSGKPAGKPSDMYQFGLLLYFMYAGVWPFAGLRSSMAKNKVRTQEDPFNTSSMLMSTWPHRQTTP